MNGPTISNFIGAEFREPRSGRWIDNIEPATGQVIGRVADSNERDVSDAVAAAQAAFPAWSATPAQERSRLLLRIADLIDAGLDVLAAAESTDTGKPITVAREMDIPRAAANLRFFATAILHTESAMHETDGGGGAAINYTLRRPRGVAGLISPWNLPLYLLTWKVAPALATGNTVVGKPSELTPTTASMLGRICAEAGLPPGVLNFVHGTGTNVGAALVAHPDVPTISFTGGTTTGRTIAGAASPMLKRLALELGGKNPAIVLADADLDAAIMTTVRSGFSNQGQICLCTPRVLVERRVFDEFVGRLVEQVRALRLGDPLETTTQVGSLVSAQHRDKVRSYVELARELGGTIHCGGQIPKVPGRCAGGFFFEPTVISGLPPSCRVEQEEIFGPVVTVSPFDTEDEAVSLANGTPYGLACTIWTRDLSRAHRMAERVEAGIVWVNCWMVRDLRTPFGGMKQSGVGREGGLEALRFFTEAKNVCFRM